MLNRIDKSLHPFSKIRKLVSLSRAKLSRRETFRETFISVPSGIVIGDALISKRWNGNGREGEGGWNTNESGSVLETEFLEFSVPPSPQIYERDLPSNSQDPRLPYRGTLSRRGIRHRRNGYLLLAWNHRFNFHLSHPLHFHVPVSLWHVRIGGKKQRGIRRFSALASGWNGCAANGM